MVKNKYCHGWLTTRDRWKEGDLIAIVDPGVVADVLKIHRAQDVIGHRLTTGGEVPDISDILVCAGGHIDLSDTQAFAQGGKEFNVDTHS